MKALERYLFGPVDAVRPFLAQRAVLLLLAFNCWTELLTHGGRYGVGDFNVAHFAWLDRLAPFPTPGLYLGVMTATGMLALVQALIRPTRWALALVFLLFTYGWSMSMLDSFQHHYLMSLLLLSMVFFPRLTASDLWPVAMPRSSTPAPTRDGTTSKKKAPRSAAAPSKAPVPASDATDAPAALVPLRTLSSWAYVLMGTNIALVYFFTAITKTSPDWRQGSPLASLGRTAVFQQAIAFFGGLGWTPEQFWSRTATATVFLQFGVFAGYLLATNQDRTSRPWLRRIAWPWVLLPISFHTAVEYMDLTIGWFSAYVLLTAAVYFLPAALLRLFARALTWPGRRMLALVTSWLRDEAAESALVPLALSAAVGALIAWLLGSVDLPGTRSAGIALGVGLVAFALLALRRGALDTVRPWLLASTVAALAFWLAITQTDARYDYYRWVGGDLRRRHDYAGALEAYMKANRYAPPGENRNAAVQDLRRKLDEQGRGSAPSASPDAKE